MSIPNFGIDNIKQYQKLFQGKRVGLLTNPSGVDSFFNPTLTILQQYCKVTCLFAPEHGIKGDQQAGFTKDSNQDNEIKEFNLHSGKDDTIDENCKLYMDILVFDIQDIGVRFYTYINTLFAAMADCAKLDIPVIVLDRPNPLGGEFTEGTILKSKFESIVGKSPLPVRTGLTAGELATFINDYWKIGCQLKVIPCSNLDRKIMFYQTGRSWLSPSPNMPSFSCNAIYAGTCFFEGTNISEGRGTTRPFEIIGAPFLDNEKICSIVNKQNLPGVFYRPCFFKPTFDKHKDKVCNGIQIHITNINKFNSFNSGMALWYCIRENTKEFEITLPEHLNKLFGDDKLLKGDEKLNDLIERAKFESQQYKEISKEYFIY